MISFLEERILEDTTIFFEEGGIPECTTLELNDFLLRGRGYLKGPLLFRKSHLKAPHWN